MNEPEFSHNFRGVYNTSFFHIYTEGDFDPDLSLLSQRDRGTFIHEYIHYWQNIGTLWGLGSSIFCYDCMLKLKAEIFESKQIHLPYHINLTPVMKRADEKFRIGTGFIDNGRYRDAKIDPTQRIEIQCSRTPFQEQHIDTIDLIIPFQDGTKATIRLGAHIVKESMAALYQSLVDPTAEHDDIPYNVVRLLCKHNYPELYDNTKLLICICHAALFSMIPGDTLIILLGKAQKENISNGMDLFYDFVNHNEANRKSIPEFFDAMIEKFKASLSANLLAPLDYIAVALDMARLSNGMPPLLSVLYDKEELSVENLNAIVGRLGIPYIHTKHYGFHHPATANKDASSQDISSDVLELNVQEAVFRVLTTDNQNCPLCNVMCKGDPDFKDECKTMPWLGEKCAFTLVCDCLNLQDKVHG